MVQVRVALLLLALLVSEAHAQKRVALVVGNADYQHTTRLANAKNDATDIAGVLKGHGFQVVEGFDLDKVAFDRKVREFAVALKGADVGVLFYAGHALQANGQNYLVPIDAKAEAEEALDFEMLKVDVVHRAMERSTNTNILFLDASRDNPLALNLARAMGARSAQIGKGLASIESGVGTLISFSTQPGAVVTDGVGRNSPYAGALVKYLSGTNDDLSAILIAVRKEVMKETGRKQVPWEHSSLTGRFYFAKPNLSEIAREERQASELFTPDDMQRLKVIANLKNLPLPPFSIYKPASTVPDNIRRFVGVWISDKGYEGTGRQCGMVVESVSDQGRAFGYGFVGPPAPKSTVLTPAAYYPFVGVISGSQLLVKGKRTEIVIVFDSQGRLAVVETWTNGIVGKVSLNPFWQLVESERSAKR